MPVGLADLVHTLTLVAGLGVSTSCEFVVACMFIGCAPPERTATRLPSSGESGPSAADHDQYTCVVSGASISCERQGQVTVLKLKDRVQSVTGTGYGGICAIDESGRLFFWTDIGAAPLVRTIGPGGSHASFPSEWGCCIYANDSIKCFGGMPPIVEEGEVIDPLKENRLQENYLLGGEHRYGTPRIPVKMSTSLQMVDPVSLMSRDEWNVISYLLGLDGIQAPGPWFDALPLENVFLRNAWLTVCAHASPHDELCGKASLMFDSIGSGPIEKLVFGDNEACALRNNGFLSCVSQTGICTEEHVDDVDIGAWSTCVAAETEVFCWPIGAYDTSNQRCLPPRNPTQ